MFVDVIKGFQGMVSVAVTSMNAALRCITAVRMQFAAIQLDPISAIA